jgi:hypothetical protein
MTLKYNIFKIVVVDLLCKKNIYLKKVVMCCVLDLLTGCIELREDTVETLLSTARLLQLTAVVDACCSFLMKQLHPSNCIGIRLFADTQGCMDLLKVAHNYTTVRTFNNYLLSSF